jgi:hypothetical protein
VSSVCLILIYRAYTKNGAVSIEMSIETAPFFCVYLYIKPLRIITKKHIDGNM